MTTIVKVVEFYRNSNLNLNSSNIITNNDNDSLSKINGSTSALSRSNSISISNNIVYNTLGFNVIGGYLSEIPATIVDVNPNGNGKVTKVCISLSFHLDV